MGSIPRASAAQIAVFQSVEGNHNSLADYSVT